MQAVSKESKGISIVEYFQKGLQGEPLPSVEWYKAPAGINQRLMPLVGTYIEGSSIPGQPEIMEIIINKEKDPGDCEGGICVEVLYHETFSNGDSVLIDVHINGNDKIAPNGLVMHPEFGSEDFEAALQEFDARLVQLGLLLPKQETDQPKQN